MKTRTPYGVYNFTYYRLRGRITRQDPSTYLDQGSTPKLGEVITYTRNLVEDNTHNTKYDIFVTMVDNNNIIM